MADDIISPTNNELLIDDNDLITSKTDCRGIIQYANERFCKISGFEESELVGQPHRVIRHPDMPKCIFYALWENIKSGNNFAFYSKNLNKSKDYYWGKTYVESVIDVYTGEFTGYHSIRKAFDRKLIPTIEGIYEKLINIEKSHDNRIDGIMSSYEVLQTLSIRQNIPIYEISEPDIILALVE